MTNVKELIEEVDAAIENSEHSSSETLNHYLDDLYSESDPESFGQFVVEFLGQFNTQGNDLEYHDGQALIRVVKINDNHYGQGGYYSSHGGTEFDGEWNEVELAQKTIDYWQNK